MVVSASGAPSLWRDRSFVVFYAGSLVSTAGAWVTYVVLPILVYQLTGSALQTSLVTALEVVPYLLFGLPAGALADRLDRRRVMITCRLASALLVGSIPVAGFVGALTLPHVYAVAFLSASVFVWFDAASFGAVPALVGKDRLVQAQSALWAMATAMGIVAPSVGGLLAATVGPATTIAIDAFTYLLGAAALLLVPRSLGGGLAKSAKSTLAQTIADVREGLAFLWRERLVRTLTLLGFGVSFSGGAVTGLLVVYAVEALGLREDDGRIGLLFTAAAVGSLAAALALPRLTRRVAAARISLVALQLDVALVLAVAVAPTLTLALVLLAVQSAVHMLIILNGITLRQLVTPDELQGRVNTTARMIAWGGTPFGAITGGVIADAAGVRTAILATALGVGVSAALAWFSPLRGHDVMERPLEAPA